MGRRKKEPRYVHRAAIAAAAAALFQEKGVAATSMDDIARAAGYSKATLYVYFANKEALVGLLALESMEQLRDALAAGLAEGRPPRTATAACAGAWRRTRRPIPSTSGWPWTGSTSTLPPRGRARGGGDSGWERPSTGLWRTFWRRAWPGETCAGTLPSSPRSSTSGALYRGLSSWRPARRTISGRPWA